MIFDNENDVKNKVVKFVHFYDLTPIEARKSTKFKMFEITTILLSLCSPCNNETNDAIGF